MKFKYETNMKNIELLHLKAIRQSDELATTLRQLEAEAREVGTTDTAENVASILVDAEDVRDALAELIRENRRQK